MILDKNLIFVNADEGEKTASRAICLAQNDLLAPTDGIGPYEGLWLVVTPTENVAGLAVTLQHCDTETGTFADLVAYPAADGTAGVRLLATPVPHVCKNWLKLSFNKGFTGNAMLTIGVDKFE